MSENKRYYASWRSRYMPSGPASASTPERRCNGTGAAGGDGALHAAAGVNNRLRCRNLAAEVRRIQGATQNRLVHLTQLRQG